MSYKTNSPVKQVWLPIDYSWLTEVIGGANTFGNFSKAYKERYGIDLHDLFELKIDEFTFTCSVKVDLLGTYNVDKNNYETSFALPNGVIEFRQGLTQGEDRYVLAAIGIKDSFDNFACGFKINLPVEQTPVNSIDDLEVTLYEL